MQQINNQFSFANNVFKQFVKLFYQINIFILYESICFRLQANTKTVIDTIMEKNTVIPI